MRSYAHLRIVEAPRAKKGEELLHSSPSLVTAHSMPPAHPEVHIRAMPLIHRRRPHRPAPRRPLIIPPAPPPPAVRRRIIAWHPHHLAARIGRGPLHDHRRRLTMHHHHLTPVRLSVIPAV